MKSLLLLMAFSLGAEAGSCRSTLTPPTFEYSYAQEYEKGGQQFFVRDILITGASLEKVIWALQNVDPTRVAPLMKILSLDSPNSPDIKNFFLRAPGPDFLSLLGSKIEMIRTTAGFYMTCTGPVVSGWDSVSAFRFGDVIVVRETGTLGGVVQNRGHQMAFDLIPELRRLLVTGL